MTKNRQAISGNRHPPALARPERRSTAAPAVTPVLEELELPLRVLVETVELVPVLELVVGLGELVPDPELTDEEPLPVADGVELGDCLELADVVDVAVALEPPEPELPEVVVAAPDAAPEEAVLDAEAEVNEPLVLPLLPPPLALVLEDISVLEGVSVLGDVSVLEAVLDADEVEVVEEGSSLEDELKAMAVPLFVLVCWAVVCSEAVDVTSSKAEVDVAEVAEVAVQ